MNIFKWNVSQGLKKSRSNQVMLPEQVLDTGKKFREIAFTSDFKKWSYGPITSMLQGHAVTLTLKVATQMMRATRRFNMVIIYVK